jgi:hypothetical protein
MKTGKLDFVVVGTRRGVLQSHLDAFIQEGTRAAKEEMAEKKRDARISANSGSLIRASLLWPVVRSSQAAHQPARKEIVPFLGPAVVSDHRTLITKDDLEAIF